MPPITREMERRRGIKRWRCGACLFELPDYLRIIDADSPFGQESILSILSIPLSVFRCSVERGCKICRLIVSITGVSSFPDNLLLESSVWRRGALFGLDENLYQVFRLENQGLTLENPASFHPFIDIGDFPSGDTRGSLAFGRLKSYLHQCLNNHEVCAQRSSDRTMPQRIISVDDYTTSSAHLIDDTREIAEQPYVCLSHRWTSQTRDSSLTQKSAELFKGGIPKELLYQVFVDAFEITQRLGYRYIWIDCFCIYQDDLNDWHQQASEMAEIYENAEFTISAVATEVNNGRIFGQKTPQAHKLCTNGGRDVFIRRVDNLHPSWIGLSADDSVSLNYQKNLSLLRRGWVFQECILSRRIIYFTEDEIILECREAVQCECGSDKVLWAERKSQISTLSKMDWLKICQDYSSCELSFLSDKLPALSGISARFGQARAWTYLAGLWREDPSLTTQLMWHALAPRERLRDSGGHLPSWSWASVNSPIGEYTMNPSKITICVVDHDILYGSNPYGTPRYAKLVVEGPSIPAILKYGPDFVIDILLPETSAESETTGFPLSLGASHSAVCPDYLFNRLEKDHVHSGERIILLVCSFDDEKTSIDGLVLKPIDTSGMAFERVGLAHYYFGNKYMLKQLQRRWKIRKITLV